MLLLETLVVLAILSTVGVQGWFVVSELQNASADREQITAALKRVEVEIMELKSRLDRLTP